jgi:putative ABC transport system substrate-binding protein
MMKRREFITLLGGVAARGARAAAARVRRIGVLLNVTADDPQSQARLAAFAQGLQQLGWTIGQNVLVDYRWGRAVMPRSCARMPRNWLRSAQTSSWPIPAPLTAVRSSV